MGNFQSEQIKGEHNVGDETDWFRSLHVILDHWLLLTRCWIVYAIHCWLFNEWVSILCPYQMHLISWGCHPVILNSRMLHHHHRRHRLCCYRHLGLITTIVSIARLDSDNRCTVHEVYTQFDRGTWLKLGIICIRHTPDQSVIRTLLRLIKDTGLHGFAKKKIAYCMKLMDRHQIMWHGNVSVF